mgnify:CR=1 FL=1
MTKFKPHPKITIYDNVFNMIDQKNILEIIKRFPFLIGFKDDFDDTQAEYYLHHMISSETWKNCPDKLVQTLLDTLKKTEPYQEYFNSERQITHTVANCDTIADSHRRHWHPNQDVILYYANTVWNKDEWNGETFFYDDEDGGSDNIVFATSYTPNRMIAFDGELTHKFNGPSRRAPKYRFSIGSFFSKDGKSTRVFN